jgi:conjugal transfer/entry exclusion protein
VDTHNSDGREEDVDDPWQQVAHQFGSLGQKLRDRYREVAGEAGPSDEEVQRAIGTLTGAIDRIAEAVGTAVRDPEVMDQMKRAAASFGSAVSSAFSGLGERRPPPEED